MVNRIVKESDIGNANFLIKKCLFHYEEATFQEIREYLEEHEIKYRDKRGLYYRLKKLTSEGIIEKIEYQDTPKYCLSGSGRKDPSTLGLMIKYEMIDYLEFIKIKFKQEDYWHLMTSVIGFYSAYVEALSFRLFKNEKALEKRLRSQEEFLHQALPLRIFTGDWTNSTKIFDKKKLEKNVEKLSSEFEKFSKTLKKSNSLLYELCAGVENNVIKKITKMQDISN